MLDPLRRRLPSPFERTSDGALGGQVLLAASAVTVMATLPFLRVPQAGPVTIATASVVLAGLLALSTRMPWRRWPPSAAVAFPVLVVLGLGLLRLTLPEVGAAYVGLYGLCFVHSGLFLPRRAGWTLLPLALAIYVGLLLPWDRVEAVRTVIIVSGWLLLAQVLRALTVRHEQLNDRLRGAATTDPLTGLGNRRALDERLLTAVPGDLLVMCDLDHFKRVNDSRGHAGGDAVLADFGRVLRAELRGRDLAARFGGEEFVLHLVATAPDEGIQLLGRLHESWATVHPDVTFSTGAAPCGPDGPGEALVDADRALYRAKADGRDRDVVLGATAVAAG